MKLSVLQENLHAGLAMVARAVSSRSTLPVLNNILLSSDNNRLKLSATDLTIAISTWVGAKVEQAGEITIPAKLLNDFINALPPERVDLKLDARTSTLNLKCSRFECNIKGMDATEFPASHADFSDRKWMIDPDVLRGMINQVVFAAASDESRPVLTGIRVCFEGSKVSFAAFDGFRLSMREGELVSGDASKAGKRPIVVPARALIELNRIMGDTEDPVEFALSKNSNQAIFRLPNAELQTQLVEGAFPDVQALIPKKHQTRTVIGTADFLKAVRLAAFFARDSGHLVRLCIKPGDSLTPGSLRVSSTTAEIGDQVGEIDALVEGPACEIAFNAKYLSELLGQADSAQIALETNGADKPGAFRLVGSDAFVHVIMPMHIQDSLLDKADKS